MVPKYKIVSDGTVKGVKIFDPQGADITKNVKSYEIRHECGDLPRAKLEVFADVDIELPFKDQAEIETTTLGDQFRSFEKPG